MGMDGGDHALVRHKEGANDYPPNLLPLTTTHTEALEA
jgi:hypothetical protein